MVDLYNIYEAADELENENAWRNTPYPLSEKDYVKIIVHSIKKLFVDINHPDYYDQTLFTTDETDTLFYDFDFNILQEEYIRIISNMRFLNLVLSDLSGDGAVSYTTNALSVTGAKEGYKSIQQELDTLERERIRVFHKMMARDEG